MTPTEPTQTIDNNGTEHWMLDGIYHREDGPAMATLNGALSYYKHGRFHRLDGPAMIFEDGMSYWYINGKRYSEIEFNFWMGIKESA